MMRKVLLIADPGIDTAFAIALAMHDPNLDVIGIVPCAGNVSAEQATTNVLVLVDQLEPAKWPRTASALPATYDLDGTALHGPCGLGDLQFPMTSKHQHSTADKAIIELVRAHPREVTVLCLGPATTLSVALTRDPELAGLLDGVVLVGGTYREPGNAGPVAEFHFWLDALAARHCLRASIMPIVIPLDVTRKLVLSPTELLELPNPEGKVCRFLRQIVPFGIRASSHLYGIEGFHLKDVMAIAALALPGSLTLEAKALDVEPRGELTRGMLVVDDRANPGEPTARLATDLAAGEIRQWIERILKLAP